MAGVATMGPVIAGGWIDYRPDNRGFATAVVASVVFHSVLLAGWQMTQPAPAQKPSIAPGPIVARLAAPPRQAAAPEPAAQTPEPPKPRVEEPPPPPAPAPPPVAAKAPPTPVAKPAPVAKAAPSQAPAPSPSPSATPTKPSADPTPATPAAPSAPVAKGDPAPAASPSAAPAPSVDADPGTLKQYQLAIITTARKYKRYPRAAMDNNWEGKVEVRMVIGANGMIASISIKTSTGHELLDKTALDMITKAKPLTPIPAALRGTEFTVDVPVVFSLKDEAPSS